MKGTYNYEKIKPLMTYFKQFGTISDIKQNQLYMFDGKIVKIGLLVSNLRTRYNKGLLTPEEISFFETKGIIWNKRKKNEDEGSM